MPRTVLIAHATFVDRPVALAAAGAPARGVPPSAQVLRPEDALYFATDLVHEGRNGNGDVFTRAEMEQSYGSLIGMPIDLDHEMKVLAIVGQIYDARCLVENGQAVIRIAGYVHRRFYPVVAWLVQAGIVRGVSMECLFAQGQHTHQGRVLHGVQFIGMAICRVPADQEALIDSYRDSEVTATRALLLDAAACAVVAHAA